MVQPRPQWQFILIRAVPEKSYVLILPDCPPIVSLGELVMDMDFDFVWKAKTLPVITMPEGVSHQLELDSRVPIWPLRRARVLACAGGRTQQLRHHR